MMSKIFLVGASRRRHRKRLRERLIINESGLFDAEWYQRIYPDVAGSGHDPLDHYLLIGALEQRATSPEFDTRGYITANPDVATSPMNPLVHYIKHGKAEGRGFAKGSRPSRSVRRRSDRNRTPSFSLLVQAGPRIALQATLASLRRQGTTGFEVVAACNDPRQRQVLDLLGQNRGGEADIRLVVTSGNAPFLQEAIDLATSDYIIVLEAGDVLAKDALAQLAKALARHEREVLYSDEAVVPKGGHDPLPVLKPGWSPELLAAYNYFGRLTAIRRSVAVAALPEIADGVAAEWSLNLAVTRHARNIARLPRILCHRHVDRTDRSQAKEHRQAYTAILTEHWHRLGRVATVTPRQDGTFHSTWSLEERPLVSVIIPNKDRAHLLRVCLDGLFDKTDYRNIEIIVVDNGSTEDLVLKLYDELRAQGGQVVAFDEDFNYSRACNLGARAARGELLLFLNNDIEMVESDWLDELVRQIMQPGVGIAGPKLLYPDGGIQHAGVVLGLFTLAAHVFHRAPLDEWGPFGSPDVQRNWTAVTGACQLVHRDVFDLVGGYDEAFIISYSDIVLCTSVARAGFRTVYAPRATLVHHEGASRGHTNPSSDQILFAKRLRETGFDQDPLYHPALDTLSFVPKLKSADLTGSGGMRGDTERLASVIGAGKSLDIYDDGAVASAMGLPWDEVMWRFDPAALTPGASAGARILLTVLRLRPDLRRRFPRALRDGAAGEFADWVRSHGLTLLRLPKEAAAWVDAAFESDLGGPARQCLLYDADLRSDPPLALLPTGRITACQRLFEAFAEDILTREEIWWFLMSAAEAPLEELCMTWALTPAWQDAVPDGATAFGFVSLVQWVAATYGISEDWLFAPYTPAGMTDLEQLRLGYSANDAWRERFPNALVDPEEARDFVTYLSRRASGLPFTGREWASSRDAKVLAAELERPGVNILGHFSYPSGLRISAESMVEGLRANGLALSVRDVPVSFATDDPISHRFLGPEIFDTTIIHVQPQPLFSDAYGRAGLRPRSPRTYRIGYWYWELDDIPSDWNRAAFECDEIWTATEFIAEGLRRAYPQPVRVMCPGVEIETFDPRPRAYFGLPEDEFLFLFIFHMTSVMTRKNPLGLISAFRKAFDPKDQAKLVIKTSFGSEHPEQMSLLKEAAAEAGVILLDKTFSRHDTLALIQASDAYVSLHRSEGLGLTMAEAMLLGRPTIGTRYSGNLEFMNDDNSLLCDHRLVTLNHDLPPYQRGQRWAEPSTRDAARLMRQLYDHQDFARDLGLRGQRDLQSRLSYRASGQRMAQRLKDIKSMP